MTDLPGQPDGIEDDSRDLPDPVRAAERVREYICASGDGLYDIQGGAPLYARDLEAITRAVRDRATALEPSLPLPVADGSKVGAVETCPSPNCHIECDGTCMAAVRNEGRRG